MTLATTTFKPVNAETPRYELTRFGLSLGVFEDTYKYHIFADVDTADFIVQAMNTQRNRPRVSCGLVFPDFVPAHSGYEESYAAELRRGRRIFQALGEEAIMASSPEATVTLRDQMVGMAIDLMPAMSQRLSAGLYQTLLVQPQFMWESKEIYNDFCRQGVTPAPDF